MSGPPRRLLVAVRPVVLEGALAAVVVSGALAEVVQFHAPGAADPYTAYDAAIVTRDMAPLIRAEVLLVLPPEGRTRARLVLPEGSRTIPVRSHEDMLDLLGRLASVLSAPRGQAALAHGLEPRNTLAPLMPPCLPDR